jgi:predicted phage baseplate assembly protein
MTRPLGVKGVTNPLAPSGAADRESLDDSRRNAPLTVLTLGRIVSLQDYEDFARAFSGIDKALATWSWSGEKRRVFVTVAGSQGAEVPSDSVLAQNLLTAMRQAGDPNVPLLVASYEPRLFRLSAALQVHPDHAAEKVLAAVEQRLRESFSFEARSFGQPVHLSEIIAVMQNVTGVVAVDVNELYRTDQPAQLRPRLEAGAPRLGDDKLLAAELLTLDPRPLELEVLP